MSLDEIITMVSGEAGKTLTEAERSNLIRMLERAEYRGAMLDLLIEECKALLA